jgi:hypothetical protein
MAEGRAHGIRIFESYEASPEDKAKAAALPSDACPRRYCWWWKSLSFEWDASVTEGCQFRSGISEWSAEDREKWPGSEHRCCRLDPDSPIDHYEPREPHLIEDGFEEGRFLNSPDWRKKR